MGLVGWWLRGLDVLVRPLVLARVHPNLVTAAALGTSCAAVPAAAAGGRWALGAGAAVLLSGLLDGLDGAVAVRTDRVTELGARLDGWADRAGEVAFGAVLASLGAPAGVVVPAVALGWTLEAVRHRAAAGTDGAEGPAVVVVTVAERPTRVLVVGMSALAAGALAPPASDPVVWATAGAAVWAVLGVAGLAQWAASRPGRSAGQGRAPVSREQGLASWRPARRRPARLRGSSD